MAKYYRQQGETKQRKLLRIVRPIMLVIFLAAIFVVGYFAYDIFRQQTASESSSEATKPSTSTIASNVNIQTTPYFQIQTPLKWRAVVNETRDGHYVYRQFNGQLVEQDLIIDVNDSTQVNLATTRINRVLPITVSPKGIAQIVNGSLEHCKKVTAGSKNQAFVIMSKVNFPCNPDSTAYEVVVGLVNGSNIMLLSRPDGSKATYKVTYRDVSANPTARDLLKIIGTFETR
jgi:hypothetical protein